MRKWISKVFSRRGYKPGELTARAAANIAYAAQKAAKRGDCREARTMLRGAKDTVATAYARDVVDGLCPVGGALGRYGKRGVRKHFGRNSRRSRR